MVFTWKDSLFIAGMTAILIVSGTVHANAARPLDPTAKVATPVAHRGALDLEAAQPPVPQQKLLVFFEPRRAELGPTAKEIVEKAAVAARNNAPTVIQVADVSMTDNKTLALARAETVKEELVRLGVSQEEIVVSSTKPPGNSGVAIVTE